MTPARSATAVNGPPGRTAALGGRAAAALPLLPAAIVALAFEWASPAALPAPSRRAALAAVTPDMPDAAASDEHLPRIVCERPGRDDPPAGGRPERSAPPARPPAAGVRVPAAPRALRRTFIVTAYCPCARCCGRWADVAPHLRRLASGAKLAAVLRAGAGCIAAPPDIPFGTRIAVPGYNGGAPATVPDRGGGIRGNRLDVLLPTHAEAVRWGRRRLTVTMYLPPWPPEN